MSVALAAAFGVVFGGLPAGLFALLAAGCGLALAQRDARAAARIVATATAFAPGAIVVFLSFNSGGFFAAAPAFVAVLLLLFIALQALLVERPFAGLSWQLVLAAAAMVLFSVWALGSGGRAHAPYRALVEFDRALGYALALVAFGIGGRSARRVRTMLAGVALGAFVVCASGLVTRLLPDVWHTRPDFFADQRLAYPITYWNALGILAAIGIVFMLHLTTTAQGSRWARAAAAAALPVLAVTLFFTFSRGGIAAAVIGVVLYLIVGRPRAALTGLFAAAPCVAVALVVAYDADLVGSTAARTPAATAQGHHVALVVAVAAVVAACLRLALTPVDAALVRFSLPRGKRVPVIAGAWLGGIVVVLAVALAAGAPDYVSSQYHRFVKGDVVVSSGAPRARLTSAGNNGRIEMWKIALRGYRTAKVDGHGAGTYEFAFIHDRANSFFKVSDAHSLYLELLDELGIVGLALVALPLALVLGTLLLRTRRREQRSTYAAVFAGVAIWALHTAIDWDWEMPAVTLFVFALGGAVLARRPPAPMRPDRTPLAARLLVAAGCAAIAILPVRVAFADGPLGKAVLAYQAGDCAGAAANARDATRAESDAAQGYEVEGLCAARAGQMAPAAALLRRAVAAEPANWHFHYSLAIVQAAGGSNPRTEAQTALSLNPFGPVAQTAARELTGSRPAVWRERAAPLLQEAGLAQTR